ncbi:MAG: FKBP-type peptidyl-prolyl cis-trans isomerase [bacterium]
MKRLVVLLALALACPAFAKAPTTDEEKTLYALGMAVAQQLKLFALSPDEVELVASGLRDGITGAKPQVAFEEWQGKIGDLAKARAMKAAEVEKAAGKAFLDKAASQPGAKRTPSGLVIVMKQEGQGPQATLADTVKVHYHGTLVSGEVFDSSVERGQPATFPLGGVVPCWKEGVALMKKGGKATLYCPPELAYGDRGAPPKIGPGATLIFDVELLDITPPGK